MESLVSQFSEAVGFLTQSKAHIEEAYNDHLQRGALRSGLGSPQQSFDTIKTFEESEMLIEIEETR